jgi:hypothetical protein
MSFEISQSRGESDSPPIFGFLQRSPQASWRLSPLVTYLPKMSAKMATGPNRPQRAPNLEKESIYGRFWVHQRCVPSRNALTRHRGLPGVCGAF